MSNPKFTHVAVGVIINSSNQVLISYRHPDTHQGGLWEFPGGKLESGEAVTTALKREFLEELGIEIRCCFPIKKIQHHYQDKSVLLDVWHITDFDGHANGLEGQAIEWRSIEDLRASDFPAANVPIIKLLNLPTEIAITPDVQDFAELERVIATLLKQELEIIQFRQTQLDSDRYLHWFERISLLCSTDNVKLMINHDLELYAKTSAAGYHANSKRLMQLQQRPVGQDQLFSASCHRLVELQHAEALEVDFVYLSPVCPTAKVAIGEEMGWVQFQALANQISAPVYALGGIRRCDLPVARLRGAWGISGIRAYLQPGGA